MSNIINMENPIDRISPKILSNGTKRCPNGTERTSDGKMCQPFDTKNISDNERVIRVKSKKNTIRKNMSHQTDYSKIKAKYPNLSDIEIQQHLSKLGIVKPNVSTNGTRRCPRKMKRTGDGEWCIPEEYEHVEYIHELFETLINIDKKQIAKHHNIPHAILVDDNNPVLTESDIPSNEPINDEPEKDIFQHISDTNKVHDIEAELEKMIEPIPMREPKNPNMNKVVEKIDIHRLNTFLRQQELNEHHRYLDTTMDDQDKDAHLFPQHDDPRFAMKIAKHKAFLDTVYDGSIHDIEKKSNETCNLKFELSPHQSFVRNFMSADTPYNSLLLFHSLGTGKTCSAISIAEEMREYIKQVGLQVNSKSELKNKIFVIATPNVQGNFRKQLFDEKKLKKIVLNHQLGDYTWNIESCVGNSILREINPTQIRNFPQEKLVSNINALINMYYEFMGYGQFANFVLSSIQSDPKNTSGYSEQQLRNKEGAIIRKLFNNRLVIIDEVHNIRITEENRNKEASAAAHVLKTVVKHARDMRLLLLTATPMYNSYKEIIWLTNILNMNDKRAFINVSDVFDQNGNFKPATSTTEESGEELLRRKLTGYVSYVRGENPYAFPFRIYPSEFARTVLSNITYPTEQMNGKPIESPLKHMPVYINTLKSDTLQYKVYQNYMKSLTGKSFDVYMSTGEKRNMPDFEKMDTFGYTLLKTPLELLNMTYVSDESAMPAEQNLSGAGGLQTIMSYDRTRKTGFEYLQTTKHRVFHADHIGNYSHKIAAICDILSKSEGIVLIYSNYIEGGIIPVALALEEMGISRFKTTPTTNNLFASPPPAELLDAKTMKRRSQVAAEDFKPASYVMITGDKMYSPSNNSDMMHITSRQNVDGSLIKVVLISRAGAEGLDFANVRQVHILEPWYNMSRMEQIIGRGVRNLSHCQLPFTKRNVQIFMHTTLLDNITTEAADMYVYRLAEMKMDHIKQVERVMKEVAVDCALNISQTNFTKSKLLTNPANQNIQITLSTGETIRHIPGDEETEMYQCKAPGGIPFKVDEKVEYTSYMDSFAQTNMQYIANRIRQLFREKEVYSRDELVRSITVSKSVPIEQIYHTLTSFVDNQSQILIDRYGRFGFITNRDKYYMFQPMEITDTQASVFDRALPVDYKRKRISLEVPLKPRAMNVDVKDAAVDVVKTTTDEVPAKFDTSRLLLDIDRHLKIVWSMADLKKTTHWYIHAGHVIELMEHVHSIPRAAIVHYITHHYLDLLPSSDKIGLVNSMFADPILDTNDILRRNNLSFHEEDMQTYSRVKTYFAKRMMVIPNKNLALIIISNNLDFQVFVREIEGTGIWRKEESNILTEPFIKTEFKKKYIISPSNLFDVIGFIGDFRKKELTFKVKDLTQHRNNTGAKCDSAGKTDIIKLLNRILGREQYTSENTETTKTQTGVSKIGLSVLIELLMREYTYGPKPLKRHMFLTPEQTIVMDAPNLKI